MQLTNIERALTYYGLDYTRILPRQSGYRNSIYPIELKNGQIVNFLVYKQEKGILQKINTVHSVSEILNQAGLPVRHQLDDRIMVLSKDRFKVYGCLYNYLPGSTIPWEAYTKSHIKLLGKGLATLHKELKSIPKSQAPETEQVLRDIQTEMTNYFQTPGVKKAMKTKLQLSIDLSKLQNITQDIYELRTEHQLLHMDYVRGNILFDKPGQDSRLNEKDISISGILDFEKISYGNPMHDIARTLAFLLVDCKYKSAAKIQKYFLQSGYIKRGGLEIPNISNLDSFVFFYLTHDFYKFLAHNPYEDLSLNQHYMRTRDILLKTKLLEIA